MPWSGHAGRRLVLIGLLAGGPLAPAPQVWLGAPAAQATRETPAPRGGADSLPDWRALWDFSNPAATESRFRELWLSLGATTPETFRLELWTQIARAQGLQGKFATAHATLDSIESELGVANDASVRVRCLLERGRTWNSAGHPERSVPLFENAWRIARDAGEACLAIDAAHMLGIVTPAEDQLRWGFRALEAAEASQEECARRWRGPLYHNMGMTHLEAERFAEALDLFERDWRLRAEIGDPMSRRIAKWCVAHTLRRMGRTRDALTMQRELEQDSEAAGDPDGYIFEEIAECLWVLDRRAEAGDYFRRAHALLSEDAWLAEHEPERLARLLRLAELPDSVGSGEAGDGQP